MWANTTRTATQLDAELRPWWVAWMSALPDEQREALEEYKSPRYPLFAIAQDASRQFTAVELTRFAALDAAFASAPALSEPMLVWRGFTRYADLQTGHQPWSPPPAGSQHPFPGWTSVTMVEQAAAAEAYIAQDKEPNDFSVLMELVPPTGQKVIYMETVKPTASHEAELLLPRGTHYQVTGWEPLVQLRSAPPPQVPYSAWRFSARAL